MAAVFILTAFGITVGAASGIFRSTDDRYPAAPYLVTIALLLIGLWLRQHAGGSLR